MVYIIETLQVADGSFMGPLDKRAEGYTTEQAARMAAQEQSNHYGTITRVRPFPCPEGHTFGFKDYFYPKTGA